MFDTGTATYSELLTEAQEISDLVLYVDDSNEEELNTQYIAIQSELEERELLEVA